MFAQVGVSNLLLESVPQPEVLAGLVDEMFTPGRAENNLRTAKLQDVRGLLETAVGQIGRGYQEPLVPG